MPIGGRSAGCCAVHEPGLSRALDRWQLAMPREVYCEGPPRSRGQTSTAVFVGGIKPTTVGWMSHRVPSQGEGLSGVPVEEHDQRDRQENGEACVFSLSCLPVDRDPTSRRAAAPSRLRAIRELAGPRRPTWDASEPCRWRRGVDVHRMRPIVAVADDPDRIPPSRRAVALSERLQWRGQDGRGPGKTANPGMNRLRGKGQ